MTSHQNIPPVRNHAPKKKLRGRKLKLYRGFRIYPEEGFESFKVIFLAKHLNKHLPRRFRWTSDIRNLQAYLDAIVEGDQLTTDFYEHEKGWVLDAEYLPDQVLAEGGPVIKLSPERLLKILTFKEELYVPTDAVLSIAYVDGVWFPQKIMAGLAEHYGQDLFADQPSDPDNPPSSTGAALPAPTLIEPPEETILREKSLNNYGVVEQIVILKPVDSPTYYIRRLIKDQDPIWIGSSWYPDGPFECRWQDEPRCIALRVWTDQNNGPKTSL